MKVEKNDDCRIQSNASLSSNYIIWVQKVLKVLRDQVHAAKKKGLKDIVSN